MAYGGTIVGLFYILLVPVLLTKSQLFRITNLLVLLLTNANTPTKNTTIRVVVCLF